MLPAAVKRTSVTNNAFWYIMNSIFLRYGAYTLFVCVALYDWKWKPKAEFIIPAIVIMVGINFAHKFGGHILGYYMLAIYHLDHIFILRMIKIVAYVVLYFLVAKRYHYTWMSVYIPVAHSWTGILTSKLYGYQTTGLIKEFTFLLVPPLVDLIVEEKDDDIPFMRKYSHCMLFSGVILLGFTTLLIPRVVPPRKEKTGIRVRGAWALDDVIVDAPAAAPAVPPPPPAPAAAPAVPPPPPVVADAMAADLSEEVRAIVAADPAVVAAATAVAAAHEIVLITTSVAEAATALQAAAPGNLGVDAAAARAVGALAHATAAEVAAVTVVGTAVAAATAAATATEPGRWDMCSMANGWWRILGQNLTDLCTLRKWLEWSNPGRLRFYDDFYRFE